MPATPGRRSPDPDPARCCRRPPRHRVAAGTPQAVQRARTHGACHRDSAITAALGCGRAQAYAAKLRQVGVPVTAVRYQGIIHDFVVVNALRDTHAAKAATAQGGEFLRAALRDQQ